MLHIVFAAAVLSAQAASANSPYYVWPVCAGKGGSGFGYRIDSFTGRRAFHSGLDIEVEPGHPVVASASGRVVWAEKRGPYGFAVEIDHGGTNKTRYGHLSAFAVASGESVDQGQTLGWSGATGRAAIPGLHFEVWQNEVVLDPRKHLHPNPRCAR
jgi:murein DD-endopeptidase MepM/ murein hydrolase activator NlpD